MDRKTKAQLLNELESLKEHLKKLEDADIERERVIDDLRESEMKYRLLFDEAPVGIGIADIEGNVIDANRSMQEMSGLSLENYRKSGVCATYANPEERRILLKTLREKGKVRDWEVRLKRNDGSEYYALLNADIMELGGRKVIFGIIRDISQSKLLEKTLSEALVKAQEEKNKSEAIIAALGDGIIIQDTDYKIIYQNQIQKDLYGDKIGKLCYKAYEGRNDICEDCPVEKTFRDGKIHRSERRIFTEKGDLHFGLTSSPLKDATGKIIAGITVVREITEQKRYEETLRESEEKYRTLVENIQGGVFILQDARFQYINEPFARMAGYEVDDIIGKDFREFIAPEDLELVTDYYFGRIAGKDVPKEYEFRVLRRDGTKIFVNLSISLINYHGKVASMGILRDVTQHKQVEEELKKRNLQQKAILNNIPDIAWLKDKESRFIAVNEPFATACGVSSEELVGKTDLDIWPPDLAERYRADDRDVMATGKRKLVIEPLKDNDGKNTWIETIKTPIYNDQGQVIGTTGIARDVTQRKKSEEEKNRLLKAIASSTDGITIADKKDRYIYVNTAYADIFGYSPADFIGDTWRKITPVEIIPKIEIALSETIHNKDIGIFKREVDGLRKDGKKVPTEVMATSLWDENGNYDGHICIVRNIIERKRVEDELRESKQFLENIFASIQDGIGIIDKNMNIIRVNKTAQSWYPHAIPLTGKKCYEAFHNRKEPCELCPARETLSTGKSAHKVIPKHGPGGKEVGWLEIYSYPLKDTATGQMKWAIEYVRDITERKRVEEELRQSEEKYRLLIENIQEGVFIIQDGKLQFVNQVCARATGYGIEELIGMDFYKFVALEDVEMIRDRYYRRQRGEALPSEYEFHVLRRSGEKMLVNMRVGIVDYRGKVATMGILQDITERKRVENLIKESEEKYRNLVELTTDIINISDKNGNQIFMNDAGYKILEAIPEEVIGRQWSKWIHPEDRERSLNKFTEMVDNGIDVFDFENRYLSRGGRVINVLHNIRILRNDRGEVIGTQGIARDITERKRVEESLKLFSETVENAPDGVQITDIDGKIIYSNRAVEKMFGFSIDELIGKSVEGLNVDPEIAGKVIIPAIKEKGSWTGELLVRHRDGHTFMVWLTTSIVKNKTGMPIAMVGIIRDITERKHSEEALRLSSLVVENSPTVLFRWKAEEGWPVEFVSNNVTQFGYSPTDFLSGALPYASIVHPDDVERVSNEVLKHSESGDDRFQQEYRIIAKNGTVHWIDDRTVIERDRNGQITNYQGIIIDITERKQTEEAIKKYNRELEESNRMKELFTDIMHHDLLNPLNVAKGYVELFLEDETNFQKKYYLEKVNQNLAKGMELIDNATKFSKLESMKYIEFEDMDLKTVVEEAVENLNPLAVRAGMNIENNLKGRMPARANKIIEDIFTNIISNAIKYASQGKRIVVDGKDGGNFWSIRIIDFGVGIRDAEKKSIFERFHREEKKGVKGSGLGLAIAGKIVELNKGRIWVEDNPEGGAIFVVEIPKY